MIKFIPGTILKKKNLCHVPKRNLFSGANFINIGKFFYLFSYIFFQIKVGQIHLSSLVKSYAYAYWMTNRGRSDRPTSTRNWRILRGTWCSRHIQVTCKSNFHIYFPRHFKVTWVMLGRAAFSNKMPRIDKRLRPNPSRRDLCLILCNFVLRSPGVHTCTCLPAEGWS